MSQKDEALSRPPPSFPYFSLPTPPKSSISLAEIESLSGSIPNSLLRIDVLFPYA